VPRCCTGPSSSSLPGPPSEILDPLSAISSVDSPSECKFVDRQPGTCVPQCSARISRWLGREPEPEPSAYTHLLTPHPSRASPDRLHCGVRTYAFCQPLQDMVSCNKIYHIVTIISNSLPTPNQPTGLFYAPVKSSSSLASEPSASIRVRSSAPPIERPPIIMLGNVEWSVRRVRRPLSCLASAATVAVADGVQTRSAQACGDRQIVALKMEIAYVSGLPLQCVVGTRV